MSTAAVPSLNAASAGNINVAARQRAAKLCT